MKLPASRGFGWRLRLPLNLVVRPKCTRTQRVTNGMASQSALTVY